jgi:hypothetical protein
MICREIEPASCNGRMSSTYEERMRRSHMCLDRYRSLTSTLQCPTELRGRRASRCSGGQQCLRLLKGMEDVLVRWEPEGYVCRAQGCSRIAADEAGARLHIRKEHKNTLRPN